MNIFKIIIIFLLFIPHFAFSQNANDFVEIKEDPDKNELKFIGYYFMRGELNNIAPTNEFLKGQVVGRLFGGNTTVTSKSTSRFIEQRFIPLISYSPRLFDGWATMRMSFEFDWTWGDANYGAGGNFGGAFSGDFVNMQTQNLYIEFRPQKNLFINAGLTRLFDNIRVPSYTFLSTIFNTGFRLAIWGSDATGLATHYLLPNQRFKAGFYQLYENNVEQDDDVVLYEAAYERDIDIVNTIGLSFWYLTDLGNGEGGVSILGQGLNSGLSNYNGVFNFNLGNGLYHANIYWLGSNFHGNPLLNQGRFGYSGFIISNFGTVDKLDAVTNKYKKAVDISGYAGNLRLVYKYGRTANDYFSFDGIFTTGDEDNISDGKYNGILTGNNWTAPGAVFISHGLYLLLPHGYVVNRFNAAVIDIQNVGYGLRAASLVGSYDIIPNKVKIKGALGYGMSAEKPRGGGDVIGTEYNLNILYRPKVFMDLEIHAAYLELGDFFDSSRLNGGLDKRPKNPWTIFATVKWIMF